MATSHTVHKSAIIGAGVTGLAALKYCLEEGIQAVCFEQHDDIGGVWYYSRERRSNQGAGAFQNLITNTPQEISHFSDFPFSKDHPQFMSHADFLVYLKDYARHFELYNHIRFNTCVLNVWPTEDYLATGRWYVKIRSQDEEVTDIFDSVFVCSGQTAEPLFPNIPGRETFKGEQVHMIDYRVPSIFTGKRVLIIGNQHSSGDAASDASSCSKQTYISLGREGTIFITRLNASGRSAEMLGVRRISVQWTSPEKAGQLFVTSCLAKLDYKAFGLPLPGNPFLRWPYMVTDDMIWRVVNGRVKPVPAVIGYTETGVTLEGGQSLGVDLILYATGYKVNYDFIDDPRVKGRDVRLSAPDPMLLYKSVFPVDLAPHHTLLFPSAMLTRGSFIPVLEMRARWGARVVAGRTALPPSDQMVEYSRRERQYCLEKFGGRYKFHWMTQCDTIAKEFGVFPTFMRLLFYSPLLAYKVYFGPPLSEHYRLLGPGYSPVAEERIHLIYDQLFPGDIAGKITKCALAVSSLTAVTLWFLSRRAACHQS